MASRYFIFLLAVVSVSLFHAAADHGKSNSPTSIVFSTLGRSSYAFDIFTLSLRHPPSTSNELKITDGISINYNGHFPSPDSLARLGLISPDQGLISSVFPPIHLMYVTERNGASRIYLDSLYHRTPDRAGSRSILEEEAWSDLNRDGFERVQVPIVGLEQSNGQLSMKDKPTLVGEYLVYVSTHENSEVPRKSWNAIYSTHLKTGVTTRLTPYGIADFSPAVSPSGLWTAVASSGEEGWGGEVDELRTDIYLFLTRDGSKRVKVVEHGGWPTWADEYTFFFHRRSDDGWWSVYRALLPRNGKFSVDSVVTQRVTPPGLHAFTPAASVTNKSFIVVATRRADSEFRHIELFDLVSKRFVELTRPISPHAHHYNPFISPDSGRIGYHRCRGSTNGQKSSDLALENLKIPLPGITFFRIDGYFPSFSPGGDRIAYVDFDFMGVYVMNSEGSGSRQVFKGICFSTAWDKKRKGVVYTNTGPAFGSESTRVDIISINVDDEKLSYKQLTDGGENNAFPSPSPDGKWVVFRSGRSGHKNLYVMDALEGEAGGIYRLTEGPWTDTMCNWSPDGEWIVFSSDRENPGSENFDLFMVHPNGTGLHKLFQSGSGGRANHAVFNPAGDHIVFTSDYAGVSAEPISFPNSFQPYGEIFVMKLDGSGITRLTHNPYEDGTPTWGPRYMRPVDVIRPNGDLHCSFDDCVWLNIRPRDIDTEAAALQYGSVKRQCA